MPRLLFSIVFALTLVDITISQRVYDLPFGYQFRLPEWLDQGGKLNLLPTDSLAVIDCLNETKTDASCDLVGDAQGVFVCRRIANVPFSICTPNVQDSVLGVRGDQCGCCGEECPQQCPCVCDEGRGVMLETKLVRWWTVRRCISRTVAEYLIPLRREIKCDTSCMAN